MANLRFNPNSDKAMTKLATAIEWSRARLRPFREHRLNSIRNFVGSRYGEGGRFSDQLPRPTNFLETLVNIHLRQIAANNPAVMVRTPHRRLRSASTTLELAINHNIREIKLGKTLRRIALDGMFGLGVAKIGIDSTGQVMYEGELHELGQVYVDPIHLDDWVHDMTARSFETVSYKGNRYRLPFDYVMEDDKFKNKDGLSPTGKNTDQTMNEGGDERDISIQTGQQGDPAGAPGEYREYIELYDLYLPEDKLLITVPVDFGKNKPLRVVEWEGPERGPFKQMGFIDVPGNSMPLSMVSLLHDLDDLGNKLFRKLGRQAERQKTVTGVQGSAKTDGSRVLEANDGQMITMDRPDGVKEFRYGGADPGTLAMFLQVKDMFSYFGGNLDLLGGLSPQSETVGQDKLLAAAGSKRIADMQERIIDFAKEVTEDMAWYLWHDPLIELPLIKRIPKVNVDIPVNFTPEQIEGDFLDYNFSVSPYSMQHTSPQQRMQTLTALVSQFIIPLMPVLEQQGIVPNFEGILRMIAKDSNLQELEDILVFQGPPAAERPGPVQPRQSPVTRRENVRINRPGATRQAKDDALANMLQGAKRQSSENAVVGRSVG